MGVDSPKCFTLSLSSPYEAGFSGVQIGPGATPFTRMRRLTRSSFSESERMNAVIAPFVAE